MTINLADTIPVFYLDNSLKFVPNASNMTIGEAKQEICRKAGLEASEHTLFMSKNGVSKQVREEDKIAAIIGDHWEEMIIDTIDARYAS